MTRDSRCSLSSGSIFAIDIKSSWCKEVRACILQMIMHFWVHTRANELCDTLSHTCQQRRDIRGEHGKHIHFYCHLAEKIKKRQHHYHLSEWSLYWYISFCEKPILHLWVHYRVGAGYDTQSRTCYPLWVQQVEILSLILVTREERANWTARRQTFFFYCVYISWTHVFFILLEYHISPKLDKTDRKHIWSFTSM